MNGGLYVPKMDKLTKHDKRYYVLDFYRQPFNSLDSRMHTNFISLFFYHTCDVGVLKKMIVLNF